MIFLIFIDIDSWNKLRSFVWNSITLVRSRTNNVGGDFGIGTDKVCGTK